MTEALRKYNNLTQRIITGLAGAAAIVTAVCLGPWYYFAVFFIICALTLYEFYSVAAIDGVAPDRFLGMISGMLVFCFSFFIEMDLMASRFYFLLFPLIALLFIVKLYKRESKPFTNIAFTLLGIVYIALPLSLLHHAAFGTARYNFEIILGSLLILWATDTGAYFAGTYLGRTKLFERISPKKTWEGFAGGAALALVFAYGMAYFGNTQTMFDWLVIAVIIIVGGTFGDLVESLLKRSIAIKDSGTVLPGHGGFLDRFDGLLISAPFIAAYIEMT